MPSAAEVARSSSRKQVVEDEVWKSGANMLSLTSYSKDSPFTPSKMENHQRIVI